jgi:hypothetical protein
MLMPYSGDGMSIWGAAKPHAVAELGAQYCESLVRPVASLSGSLLQTSVFGTIVLEKIYGENGVERARCKQR